MENREKFILRHVSVLPFKGEEVLRNRDVLVEKGRIVAIGEALKAEGAYEIDCEGKYVMPALHDCHVHISCGDDLETMLSYGVVSVINMMGTGLHLQMKQEILEGKRFGCDLYTCGPVVDGTPQYISFNQFRRIPEELEAARRYPDIL